MCDCANAWLLGLHLLTVHAASGYEMATVGAYAKSPGGFTFGIYRNSYARLSAYSAVTFSTEDGNWSITAGVVSGYPAASLMPMLVPSRRFALNDRTHLRLSLLPKPPQHGQTAALHLSIEREL